MKGSKENLEEIFVKAVDTGSYSAHPADPLASTHIKCVARKAYSQIERVAVNAAAK